MMPLLFIRLLTIFASTEGHLEQPKTTSDIFPGIKGWQGSNWRHCSDQGLLYCKYQFNKALNISNDADWHQPGVLANAVQNIYLDRTRGYRGLIDVCSGMTVFHSCLQGMEPACINVLFFLHHQYNYHNSYEYVALLRQLHFMCGGGFLPSLRDTGLGWPCIQNIIIGKNESLSKCWSNLAASVHSSATNACPASEQLMSCYRAPFQHCGATASWWACELQRIALKVWFPECKLRCVISYEKDYVIEHADNEHGQSLFSRSTFKSIISAVHG